LPGAYRGRTSTDNAALLCWYHHDHVDTRRIAMTSTDGHWHFDTPGSYGPRHGASRWAPASGDDSGSGGGGSDVRMSR
jgi:protocatechuate 3,4-dioxygenase beta subunit